MTPLVYAPVRDLPIFQIFQIKMQFCILYYTLDYWLKTNKFVLFLILIWADVFDVISWKMLYVQLIFHGFLELLLRSIYIIIYWKI